MVQESSLGAGGQVPIIQVSSVSLGDQKCVSTCQAWAARATRATWERRPQPGSTNETRQCHRAGEAQPGARQGALGARACLPPKSMSLLTWAEENLTALETCPSEAKEEAEKQLEPEEDLKWQAKLAACWEPGHKLSALEALHSGFKMGVITLGTGATLCPTRPPSCPLRRLHPWGPVGAVFETGPQLQIQVSLGLVGVVVWGVVRGHGPHRSPWTTGGDAPS